MQPKYWTDFIDNQGLVGKEVEVPADVDLSGVGIDLQFLDEEGTRSEAEELYPGILVAQDGFIPIGCCSSGSGDPYFINARDGEGGPLYRIYHDAVREDGYDSEEAVVIVLKDYRELVAHAKGR